jgi:hypothetical protein
MSITTDGSGRRCVSLSIAAAGTVEEAWQAVASGPGLSSWWVPTEAQLGFDGLPTRLIFHSGQQSSSTVEVRDWNPPHEYTVVAEDLAAGAPALQITWMIHAGGPLGCRIEVRLSLATPLPDWDHLLLKGQRAWQGSLPVLGLYLANFAGKRCATCTVVCSATESADKVWEIVAEPLGMLFAGPGDRVKSEPDAPLLAGRLESLGQPTRDYGALLRLDEPAPGIAHLFTATASVGKVTLWVRLYFFGEQASAAVVREEPHWQGWLSELFPAAAV